MINLNLSYMATAAAATLAIAASTSAPPISTVEREADLYDWTQLGGTLIVNSSMQQQEIPSGKKSI